MMHDKLHALLPDAVYTALDANAHLSADKRFKLQEACKKSNTSALFDPAIRAPFGHQFQLSLADGAHFDPVKRGLALAFAGRSAGLETPAGGSLVDATGRRSVLLEFRGHWSSIEAEFGGAHELSGTNVNRLWEGVSFVMQARAARATAWGCPEVAGPNPCCGRAVAGPGPCCGRLTGSSKSPSCRCLRASLRVRTVICKIMGAHSIISESTIMCACSYWHDTSRYIHILSKYIQILVNTFVLLYTYTCRYMFVSVGIM
jgi:hypothetical protein